jgi:hypothetical protein
VERWEEEKGMETISPQNNLIQDSEGNEENGCPVPDSNKTRINDTNYIHKKTIQKKFCN